MRSGRAVRRRWAAALLAALAACGSNAVPQAELARAQIERGRLAYQAACAGCHELDGGQGPRLPRAALAAYGTPAGLFTYLRRTMPYGAPGALDQAGYWDITAFLVTSRGLLDLTAELDEDGAAVRFGEAPSRSY